MGFIKVKNNSQRLKDELVRLETLNPALYDILKGLKYYVLRAFGKDIVLTMIQRTKEEQDMIYSGVVRGIRKYDEKPWKSPHQIWTAFDIRTKMFTNKEIKAIKNYLNSKHNSDNGYAWTAKYHEVTNSKGKKLGKHFHIQFV